jgi:molybdate/tungstate transport system substrate-binding protein
VCLALVGAGGCRPGERRAVTVFHAASLSRALSELERRFEAREPGLDVRLEPSGSQVAARKVAELHRPADLVLSADWRVLDQLLRPRHASWVLGFAANEVVLAHGEHSPGAERLGPRSWPDVLLARGVRLGRVDERTAPLGFQTLAVWRLAELELGRPGLAAELEARCPPARVVVDSEELCGLLAARSIDYAFLLRNLVEEHRLPAVRLGPELDLAEPDRAAAYARVSVPVRLKSSEAPVHLPGAPALYGLSIPVGAENPAGGLRFAEFLLSPEGQRVLERSGFKPLPPVLLSGDGLPAALAAPEEAGR